MKYTLTLTARSSEKSRSQPYMGRNNLGHASDYFMFSLTLFLVQNDTENRKKKHNWNIPNKIFRFFMYNFDEQYDALWNITNMVS